MKHDELDDQNVIARWSSHGLSPSQMAAKAEADMNQFMEEKIADFEIAMQNCGMDPAWVTDKVNQQRVEFAQWKTTKLAELERWFARGGETLN